MIIFNEIGKDTFAAEFQGGYIVKVYDTIYRNGTGDLNLINAFWVPRDPNPHQEAQYCGVPLSQLPETE